VPPILIAGTIIVHLALVAYGVGIFREQRTHRVGAATLNWLRFGVLFDITATACMIAGSSRGPFTIHGVLGFSSLAAMITETGLAWRHRATRGDETVPRWLHHYSRLAYGWWIVAYITGAVLVMSAAKG
jgi:hypothetical protein